MSPSPSSSPSSTGSATATQSASHTFTASATASSPPRAPIGSLGVVTAGVINGRALAVDTRAGSPFIYAGRFTSPGQVSKLFSANLTAAASLTFPTQGQVTAALVDPAAGAYVVFGTNAAPAQLVRVGADAWSVTGSIQLLSGEDKVWDMVTNGSHLFTCQLTYPAQAVLVE